jgi:hypothetical protein
MKSRDVQPRRVRLCAYEARHIETLDSYDKLTWSSGEKCQQGDIQVFCISLRGSRHFEGDQRKIDAVHSIWEATSQLVVRSTDPGWPWQATFRLLVRLESPVPKRLLFGDILPAERWPQSYKGKFLRGKQITQLASVLSKRNPRQKIEIRSALEVV